MVTRPGPLQATFNSGEISEELWTRSDVKQFYAAAAMMQNVEPVPQGGFRLLDRSRHLGVARSFGALGSVTESSSEGGGRTFATLNLGASRLVAAVLFTTVSVRAGAGLILIEYLPPGSADWLFFSARLYGLAKFYTTRVAARPPGRPVEAVAVRVRFTGAGGDATIGATTLSAYGEDPAPPASCQLVPFTSSQTETYMVALNGTALADVYRDGAWVGTLSHPLLASQVREAVPVQRLETLLLFHQDVRQGRVVRAADDEWVMSDMEVKEVPQVDLGGTYEKIAEIWQINVSWPTGSGPTGAQIVMSVDGQEADSATIDLTPGADVGFANFAEALRVRLEALPGVAPGIIVADAGYFTTTSARILNITFAGEDNLGSQFVLTSRVQNLPNTGAIALRLRKGDPGGEDLFSPGRGYPGAGTFYQDRLIQGGFRSKPGAVLMSPSADYWSGNIRLETATGGILLNLDTDGAEKVQRFARARHLLLFTGDAEYFVSDRALNRQQPTNVVESSRNGSAMGVPVVTTETNVLYVSRTRSQVYTAAYDDVSQAYVSTPLTLLAKHLIQNVSDAALQRANDRTDAARYFLPRADGMMAVGLLIQSQEVTAFVRWSTDGLVRAAGVDGANRVYLLVDRVANGAWYRHVEWLEPELLLDGCVTLNLDPPGGAYVSGLDMHEGAEVWAVADGFLVGPFTVAGGAITLPMPAMTVTVGRWTPPRVVTLPLPRDVGQRVVNERPCRVHSVMLKVMDTTSLAIGANGQPPYDVELFRSGQAVDVPPEGRDEWIEETGLDGWTIEGQVEITQLKPGRLQVAAVNIQARL